MARKIDLAPRHIQYICSRGLAAGALAPSGYFRMFVLRVGSYFRLSLVVVAPLRAMVGWRSPVVTPDPRPEIL